MWWDPLNMFGNDGLITGPLEDYMPGMHEMGQIHDNLVKNLTDIEVPDLIANTPTMLPAYAVAVGQNLVQGMNNAIQTNNSNQNQSNRGSTTTIFSWSF